MTLPRFITLFFALILATSAHAATTTDQHARLADVGRVWGFLKYHHPGVMKGEIDWDGALVEAIESVLADDDGAAFEETVRALIDLADAAHGEPIRPAANPALPARATIANLDGRWLDAESSRIPEGVRARLIAVRGCERPAKNHWIAQVPTVGNTTFQTEPAHYGEYPAPAYRLLALFRYWNVMQYFFPYKYQIDGDWNATLDELVPKFLGAEDALAYHLAALEMTTRIEDSHASARSTLLGAHFGNLRFAFALSWIKGESVVVEPVRSLAGKSGVRSGDVVLAIDGKPIEERLAELRPYAGASNERGKQLRMHRWLVHGSEEAATITVRRGAEEILLGATRYPARAVFEEMTDQTDEPIWHVRDDGIGYVDMARFKRQHIEAAMKDIVETKGIIFDMRAYPDFLLYDLMPHLSPESRPFAKFTAPVIGRPGVFTETPPISVGPPSKNESPYAGKVVVLVNETTISRAEFVTMALQTAPDATVIGAQTAGADGNVSSFGLPGGITTSFTGIGVFYPDGTKTQRVGIRVDIESEPTIAGLQSGKDEVLDRAVRFIETGR